MTKEKLVVEITPYFLETGYRSFRMEDVSKKLQISIKTVYELVPGKKALVHEVLNYRNRVAIELCEKNNLDSANAVEEYIGFMSILYAYSTIENQQRNIFELKKFYKKVYDANIVGLFEIISGEIEKIYERGVEEGLFISDFDAKSLGTLFTQHYFVNNFQENKVDVEISLQTLLQNTCNLYIQAILNDEGRKKWQEALKKEGFKFSDIR